MKQSLIIFTFIFVHSTLFSQTGFSTIVNRPQEFVEAYYHPAIEVNSNKIYVISRSSYRNNYNGTHFLDEFDKTGNYIGSKPFLDSINSILIYDSNANDQNVYISGKKFSKADSLHRAFIAKLNLNMDTIWTKEFNSKENRNTHAFEKMILCKNGNIALVGVDNHNDPGTDPQRNNAIFMLLDSLGNQINYHCLPKVYLTDLESYQSLVEDNEGSFYACGYVIAWKNIPFIIKYNKEGNFIWRKEFKDSPNAEAILDGKLLKSGNLLFFGSTTKNFFSTDFMKFIFTIDTAGNEKTKKFFFSNYESGAKRCVEDNEGNLICAGQIKDNEDVAYKAWVIKFSTKGDSIWERKYVSNRVGLNARFNNISKAYDGGYYLTGLNWIERNNSSKCWVVKTDSNGCIVPGCSTDFITEKEPHKELFLLSPNPAQDYVNVFVNDVEFYDRKYDLYLYDQQGRIVQHQVVQGRVTQLDLNSLTAGMYYYRIVDERNKVRQSGKVVVNG